MRGVAEIRSQLCRQAKLHVLVNMSSGQDWMTKKAAEPRVRSPARWREAEEEENRAREGGRAKWGERREERGGADKRAREGAVGGLYLGPISNFRLRCPPGSPTGPFNSV